MRIAITGASGFLATEVIKNLCSGDYSDDVLAITRSPIHSVCHSEQSCVTWVHSDAVLAEGSSLKGVDVLLNCAFPRAGSGDALAEGLQLSKKLFEVAKSAGVKSVINVSSQSVYDPDRIAPASEEDPVCPMGDYAIAKYAVELMLDIACSNTPHVNVRLGSLVGPGFEQRVLNKFVMAALSAEPLKVVDSGQRFGYLDVQDAANAICLLLHANAREWPLVVNVGSRSAYSLMELAQAAVDAACACGRSLVPIEAVETSASDRKAHTSAIDASLFEVLYGWRPGITLQETAGRVAKEMVSPL